MKINKIIIVVIALIVIIASGWFLFGSNSAPEKPENIIQPGDGTYNVQIKNFDYNPQELRIKKGGTVVWTNQDSVGHTATSDSGNTIDSELLAGGESYSKQFNEIGTYNYHCTPHPYMKGTIIVE